MFIYVVILKNMTENKQFYDYLFVYDFRQTDTPPN